MAAHQPGDADVSPPLTSPTIGAGEHALHLSESDGEGTQTALARPMGRSASLDQKRAARGSGSQLPYRSQSRRPQGGRGGYSSEREYDRAPHSNQSTRSTRPLRYDDRDGWDDDYYDERDYWREREQSEFARHPDAYGRRSLRQRGPPPRAYLNRPPMDDLDASPSPFKPYFEAAPKGTRVVDEEMGFPTSSANAVSGINWNDLTEEEKKQVLRLPLTQWMNSNFKNHFVATLGELIGTTMFLFFAFAGTEVANIQSKANNSNKPSDSNSTTGGATGFDISVLLYISLAFGFSLMVNVWIFFRISGGLFNPAVTLAMVMVGAIKPVRAACLFVAQILGSMLASVIVRFLFPENFNVRTTISGGTSIVQGIFIEAILTAELVFTIFMLAKEKHRATFIAPVGIGLALFISEMVGVQFTGGSLNPARSFGPCVITLTFDPEHWIYWVGPLIGSLFAVLFYQFIKTLEYEMANPGADGDPTNDPTKNPAKRAEIRGVKHESIQ